MHFNPMQPLCQPRLASSFHSQIGLKNTAVCGFAIRFAEGLASRLDVSFGIGKISFLLISSFVILQPPEHLGSS